MRLGSMASYALIVLLGLATGARAQELSTTQPSPEEMAAELGITLPRRPWHTAVVRWDFGKSIKHFESVEVDITIDRDVPSTYNLYISPVGGASLNGLRFYGGLQTNINGWASKESRTRVHRGKGAIFSRWSADRKQPIGLDHVRVQPDGLCESAGYEGSFCSVRRPYVWTKGTYTFSITKGEVQTLEDRPHAWFDCKVRSHETETTTDIGSLLFAGEDFTYSSGNSAFVEVYATRPLPRSGIPKVVVTFGYPRFNGEYPTLKRAWGYYPTTGTAGSPACATVREDGDSVVVELGPIFEREEGKRFEMLNLKPNHPKT